MLRSSRAIEQQIFRRCSSRYALSQAAASRVGVVGVVGSRHEEHHGPVRTTIRGSAVMVKRPERKEDYNPEIQKIIDNFPEYPTKLEPRGTEYTAPVTSAHMVQGDEVSTLDSVAVSPEDGSVMHGRYGVIPEPAASSVPLEYLALLRPAAEGAAALRTLTEKNKGKIGTIVVYGASRVNGLSFCQLAHAAGHSIVAVVDSNHAHSDDMIFSLKNMMKEPSTAVPEEVSVNKSLFRELVQGISSGNEGFQEMDPDTFVKEFKELLQKYTEMFPNTRPAAVPQEMLEFKPWMMDKDREHWDANIQTYVKENFAPGAPPLDEAKFDATFTPQQYEIFRQKFWQQNTLEVSGVEINEMNPPDVVKQQIDNPEEPSKAIQYFQSFPYAFSLFNNEFPPKTDIAVGGPIAGAVICVNPDLMNAAKAVAAGKTLREKAEAMAFLNKSDRLMYLAACSVAQQAKDAGAPIIAVGCGEGESLPDVESSAPVTDADVQQTLKAMDIDDKGNTILNLFVQSYRANDFPFYANYAIFRKNEPLSGPREFIVLK